MARPRTFDLDQLTDTVMAAFWIKGYEATSLSDLVRETGLQKSSLYAALGNKRSMYLRALAAYDLQYVHHAVASIKATSGYIGIQTFLNLPALAAEAGDRRGCFLCNASMEMLALDEPAKALVMSGRDKLHTAIQSAFLDTPYPPQDIQSATDQVLAFYFGLRVLARSGVATPRLKGAVAIFMTGLQSSDLSTPAGQIGYDLP